MSDDDKEPKMMMKTEEEATPTETKEETAAVGAAPVVVDDNTEEPKQDTPDAGEDPKAPNEDDSPPPPTTTGTGAEETAPTDNDVEEGQQQQSSAEQPNKRVMNPRYKDVRETGSWGTISKKEMIVAAVVFGLIVIGVIVAIVLLVGGNGDDDNDSNNVIVQAPTPPPVAAPGSVTAQEQMDMVWDAIESNEAVMIDVQADSICTTIDNCPPELQNDPSQTPTIRAMSWLIHSESADRESDTVTRYALAAMYYGMGGETSWKNSTNWLSSSDDADDLCLWHGVQCSRSGIVDEIDLSSNGLTGSIPVHVGLLTTIQALWLRDNELVGELPGAALGSIPTLSILYLENNQFTGTVPKELRDNGVLQTLFIFGNDFTGNFPRDFCPSSATAPPVLLHFGLDCDEVFCPSFCCSENNCY